MSRSSSSDPRRVPWSLLAWWLLAASGAALLLPSGGLGTGGQAPAKPSEKVLFQGKWDGSFVDDQGNSGKGEYEFHGEKAGGFKVTVSWTERGGKRGEMELRGERLGNDAVSLKGTYNGTTYRYLGRMKQGQLVLSYLSIEDKNGQSGSGVSTLTRRK